MKTTILMTVIIAASALVSCNKEVEVRDQRPAADKVFENPEVKLYRIKDGNNVMFRAEER